MSRSFIHHSSRRHVSIALDTTPYTTRHIGNVVHESYLQSRLVCIVSLVVITTILDFPYPTIASLTGHTFGAGCLLALAHDYRITSTAKRYFSIPAIDLGLSFPGMGVLPRLKLTPQISRKMMLEAHRWTPNEALKDGVVDFVVPEGEIVERAKEVAEKWKVKSKAGAYGVLRKVLWGDAGKAFREISFVHNQVVGPSKAKI